MVGKSLGPYKILEQIGAGGMGDVYLGEDTRLGRKVAIKVLPSEYASDPERLARFEQEARAAAAINHPNIAVVHDIGFEPADTGGAESDSADASDPGTHFIVQEYLEGDSLRELLDKGSIPLDKALLYGTEVAEALIAAHGAGIIHRDLKPGNIFVTDVGHAKVLDFGLAKLTELAGPAGKELSMSPTMLGTVAGQVMGTAGYMAPEQVQGDADIDGRADVFAFGCVVYEMVCGKRAFGGETALDTLHAIARTEPQSLGELKTGLPAELTRIVKKCLAKDPARRYQGAGDLAVDLRALATGVETGTAQPEVTGEVAQAAGAAMAGAPARGAGLHAAAGATSPAPVSTTPGPNALLRMAPWAVTTVFAIIAGYLWFAAGGPTAAEGPTYLELALPSASRDSDGWLKYIDISDDGRHIVVDTGHDAFTLYDLGQRGGASAIAGTEGADDPLLSPDGEAIVYVANNLLQRRLLSGGNPESITRPANARIFGASWTPDNRILFVPGWQENIVAVAAVPGGQPESLIEIDPTIDEVGHAEPELLPDGRVLYTGWDDRWFVAVADPETGGREVLFHNGHGARYTPTGHLVYAQDHYLFARTLDLATLELGEPEQILDNLSFSAGPGRADFAISDNGVLAYLTGPTELDRSIFKIWPDGSREPLTEQRQRFAPPVYFSPDGTRLMMNIFDAVGGYEVWVYDIDRDRFQPIAQDQGWDEFPAWSADGESLVWTTETLGAADILIRPADASAEARPLFVSDEHKYVVDAHESGKYIVQVTSEDQPETDLWIYDENDPDNPDVSLVAPWEQSQASFSPDARYIAYGSDDSGIREVYVRPYLEGADGEDWIDQISRDGGAEPRWVTADRIVYRQGTRAMEVTVADNGGRLTFSEPVPLFDGLAAGWDIAPDGSYFVSFELIEAPRLMVVFNWFEVLEELAPRGR